MAHFDPANIVCTDKKKSILKKSVEGIIMSMELKVIDSNQSVLSFNLTPTEGAAWRKVFRPQVDSRHAPQVTNSVSGWEVRDVKKD